MMYLHSCPKQYSLDLDKALPPAETIQRVKQALAAFGTDILKQTRRIDTGRLGIPVYLSLCGPKAAGIMPTRKQMGKGASAEQAEASALMELVERYSLFAFFKTAENLEELRWSEARKKFGDTLLPLQEILHSVHEELSPEQAVRILDLTRWQFCPALEVGQKQEVQIPLNWFKILNEFNGSSAGNTFEESILQGSCELFERHVCAHIDRFNPILPSIDPASFHDQTLKDLYHSFARHKITLLIKDFSLDMGLPTVGALAYDPATFARSSEIVFTAGTATTPEKAAVRALTEIAQLAGDFETGSRYEPSGLGKLKSIGETEWLQAGPLVSLDSLPDIAHPDLFYELKSCTRELKSRGYALYSVDTTHPDLGIPSNYNIIPGFFFRERTTSASLGLFTARILAEEAPLAEAKAGFQTLDSLYPNNHFTPFFRGFIELRQEQFESAKASFSQAEPLQPTQEEAALVAFYQAYALVQMQCWNEALGHLNRAIDFSPDTHAYHNLRGVAYFQRKQFSKAASDFEQALDIDKGSAIDLANLGLCHKHLGHRLKAIEFLQAALDLEPGLSFARTELGELLQ